MQRVAGRGQVVRAQDFVAHQTDRLRRAVPGLLAVSVALVAILGGLGPLVHPSGAAGATSIGLAGSRPWATAGAPALSPRSAHPYDPAQGRGEAVGGASTSEPAPVGIADLGEVPGGGSHTYTSTALLGRIGISSIYARNLSLGSSAYALSFQLNAYVSFVSGGSLWVYWVQDVLLLDTETNRTAFENNIWNATSYPNPVIDSSAVTGNGSVQSYGADSYYGYAAPCTYLGACILLTYPATIRLTLDASLDTSGSPVVRFEFDDGLGVQTFDTVTFPFATSVQGFNGFFVNPGYFSTSTCPRCVGDVELVAGGPSGGAETTFAGPTDVQLALERWTGNDYEAVPNAFNYGVATAEGLSGALDVRAAGAGGEPIAEITNHPGTLGALWAVGSVATVTVSVLTGGATGTLYVSGTAVRFSGDSVSWTLDPGRYRFNVSSRGTNYSLGVLSVWGGELLTLEVGAPAAVVFVPDGLPNGTVWAVTLNNRTLEGTGNITFGESLGSFPYTVGSLSGYSASPFAGTVVVGSTGASVPIQWTSTQKSLLGEVESILTLKVGPIPLYGILVLLVLLGGVASLAGRRRRPPPLYRPPEPDFGAASGRLAPWDPGPPPPPGR